MKTLLLLVAIIPYLSLASDSCEKDHFPELKDLESLEKAIDWTAASDEQIRKAYCTRKTPLTDEEMNTWIQSNQSKSNINKTINGIAFENESLENLESFRLLTTYTDILGKMDPAKHKDFSSTCKKVACALKEIFGEQTSTQLQYMQQRYGLNGSHIIKDPAYTTAWTKRELDEVILSLTDFPDRVMPFQESRTLIHAPRNVGNGNTIANAVVTIYQLWNEQSPEQRRSTITHELGHAFAGITRLDEDPTWMEKSKWVKNTKIIDGKEISYTKSEYQDAIISKYGYTNEREDFAESVVAYRYNPTALHEASPGKYDMIKKYVFDNVEYTSEEACKNPQRFSDSLKAQVNQEIASWTPSEEEIKAISRRCSLLAVHAMAQNQSVDLSSTEIQNCYENSVQKQTAELLKEKIKDSPDQKFLLPMLRNTKIEIPQEKIQAIAGQTRSKHMNLLRDQLDKAMKDNYFCQADFLQYAYQRFDEDELGIDTYREQESLIKIATHSCQEKAKGQKNISQQMIR